MSKRRSSKPEAIPPELIEELSKEIESSPAFREMMNTTSSSSTRKTQHLPLLPLRGEVVFPNTIVPIVINRNAGIALVDAVTAMNDRTIVLATQIEVEAEVPTRSDLSEIGCVGQILQMLKFPDGTTRIVFQGVARTKLGKIQRQEPFPIIAVTPVREREHTGLEIEALVHQARKLLARMVKQTQQVPEELQVAAMNTNDPSRLVTFLLPACLSRSKKSWRCCPNLMSRSAFRSLRVTGHGISK